MQHLIRKLGTLAELAEPEDFKGPYRSTPEQGPLAREGDEPGGKTEWEVVAGAAGGRDHTADAPALDARVESLGTAATSADSGRAALEAAEAGAQVFRRAARLAEELAPQLSLALRRAEDAEAEAERLSAALSESTAEVREMQQQQMRLTEGFMGELRQRDAELASLRAEVETLRAAANATTTAVPTLEEFTGVVQPPAAAAAPPPDVTASSEPAPPPVIPAAVAATVEPGTSVLVITTAEPLGLAFDRAASSLKVVESSDPQCAHASAFAAGDEIHTVNGVSTRTLSWEEFDEQMTARPLVLSVRRAEPAAQNTGGGLKSRMRNIAGWTRAAAKSLAQGLEVVLDDLGDDAAFSTSLPTKPAVAGAEDFPLDAAGPEDQAAQDLPADPADAAARNRPFYDLVHASMAEACAAVDLQGGSGGASKDGGTAAEGDAHFERWLRQFHSERDDEWFMNNHTRVYNAFRPHWDQVMETHAAAGATGVAAVSLSAGEAPGTAAAGAVTRVEWE